MSKKHKETIQNFEKKQRETYEKEKHKLFPEYMSFIALPEEFRLLLKGFTNFLTWRRNTINSSKRDPNPPEKGRFKRKSTKDTEHFSKQKDK